MIAALVASCLLSKDAAVSLDWKPQVGEVHQYKVSVQFFLDGATFNLSSDLEMRVLGVSSDGAYRLSTKTSHAVSKTAGDEQSLPDQPAIEQRFDRRGVPLDKWTKQEPDPFSDLLDHLTEYQSPGHPVKVGDTWTNGVVGPFNSLFGAPRITYRLSDLSHSVSGEYARISYVATDGVDPHAATGNILIAHPLNHLVHLDVVIPHFKPDGAGDEARVEVIVQERS